MADSIVFTATLREAAVTPGARWASSLAESPIVPRWTAACPGRVAHPAMLTLAGLPVRKHTVITYLCP